MENDKFKLQRKILSHKINGTTAPFIGNQVNVNKKTDSKNQQANSMKQVKGCSSCSRRKNANG